MAGFFMHGRMAGMPQGYYTIERWAQRKKGAAFSWAPILQLPFGANLTAAERALAELDKPGLYRIVQMQRVIWAEKRNGELVLRKSHASSPRGLVGICEMFHRSNGQYPIDEIREARKKQKSQKRQSRSAEK
jgi:hypothetical protein